MIHCHGEFLEASKLDSLDFSVKNANHLFVLGMITRNYCCLLLWKEQSMVISGVTSKIDYATTGKLSTLKHRKIDYATTGKLAM